MGVGVGVRGFRVRATQEVSCLLPAALCDLVDAHVHRRAALDRAARDLLGRNEGGQRDHDHASEVAARLVRREGMRLWRLARVGLGLGLGLG